jgi:hypothetical protein
MKKLFSKLLFDRKDHELLKMVQEVLNQEYYRMNDFETDGLSPFRSSNYRCAEQLNHSRTPNGRE